MTSPTFTDRRVYRNAAVVAAFQSTPHVPVDDLSGARGSFFREFVFNPQAEKVYSMGGETTPYKDADGRFLSSVLPVAQGVGLATPKTLETLLRSWGGSWTSLGGGVYRLDLSRNLAEYATLGLVENRFVPNAENLVRVWDAWAHRVVVRLGPALKGVEVSADFAARDYDRTALDSLGPISLPSTFDAPDLGEVYAPHSVRLFRDPAGANVSVAAEDLELTFEQGLSHEHWSDTKPLVKKVGYTMIGLRLTGSLSEETYALIEDAETKTTTFNRLKAEFTSTSGKVFSVDLRNVDFEVAPVGWRGERFFFEAAGEAFLDNSGNFATILNTP